MLPLDTTADARRIQRALLRRMTPQERVRIAVAMSEEAREIAMAGTLSRHPGWSEERVRREVCARMYGEKLVARVCGPARPK